MMHNNLFLNRMIIYTCKGEVAYDEIFHRGVNIIRGENSSGKSTISQFIFYILGGAFNDWVKEATECSHVIAEVEMNGAIFTLKREINISENTNKSNAKEKMYIYWGSLNDCNNMTSGNIWQKYNFNTTTDKMSFSNLFFENLNLPIVKGENNITFHQILRLLYVDQESPTSSLFLYERFDSSLTRETVSDLLLGVYNQELYDSKQRKVEVDKEFDDVKREIKVIKKFVSNSRDLVPSSINSIIKGKEKEIHKIEETIIQYKEENKRVAYTIKTKLEFEKLSEESISLRNKINILKYDINDLYLEIEDSRFFIESLEAKRKAIKNSIFTRELLDDFPLEYCPECLSAIDKSTPATNCRLCKAPNDGSNGVTQARKMEQELLFQIKESSTIVATRERKLLELKASYDSGKMELKILQKQVNTSLTDVKSIREEKLDNLYVDKGFIEGEILQLSTLLENAAIYQALIKKQLVLEKELNSLKLSISSMEGYQLRLKKDINSKVEEKGLFFLNNDLRRQKDFKEAKEFNIDYHNNMAFISDKDAKYSASSNFYLKVAARFSLFFASLDVENMRYPRFLFCDNMEDKGIEKERAQQFQKNIIAQAEKYNKDNYQMIYTTSFIAEELRNSPYCVGEYYTEESPSLKNVN